MTDQPLDTSLSQIIRRAMAGEDEAWRMLVHAYTPRVYGLMVRQCGDQDLAEEITQATFVKVVSMLRNREGGYQERGRFEAWLFRIAMNRLRDEMRRRRRQALTMDMGTGPPRDQQVGGWTLAEQEVVAGGPKPAIDPFEAASRAEQVTLLQAAIARLSDAEQELLHLRHTAGLSFAQIAQMLKQPLGTVLAREHRAIAKLRRMLTGCGTPSTP